MSILSRLFGKKETPEVVTRKKKAWSKPPCAGTGKAAEPSDQYRNGRQLGKCSVCGHLGIPTKNKIVAGHHNKASE